MAKYAVIHTYNYDPKLFFDKVLDIRILDSPPLFPSHEHLYFDRGHYNFLLFEVDGLIYTDGYNHYMKRSINNEYIPQIIISTVIEIPNDVVNKKEYFLTLHKLSS